MACKKLLSFLVFSVFALSVLKAQIATSGNCGLNGDNLQWSFDTNKKILTITGSGPMASFSTSNDIPWASAIGWWGLSKVILPEGLTTIGERAFYFFGLSSITIPSTVEEIGSFAFDHCYNLDTLIIPNSVTTIKDAAFSNCSKLSFVSLPANLKTVPARCFASCTTLVSITLPANVDSIAPNAFENCTSLRGIVVEEENTTFCSHDSVLYSADSTRIIIFPQAKNGTHTTPFALKVLPSYYLRGLSIEKLYLPGVEEVNTSAIWFNDSLQEIHFSNRLDSFTPGALYNNRKLNNLFVDETNAKYISVEGVLYSKDTMILFKYPDRKGLPWYSGERTSEAPIHDSVRRIVSHAFSFLYAVNNTLGSNFRVNLPPHLTSIDEDAFWETNPAQFIINAYNGHIPNIHPGAFTQRETIYLYVPFNDYKIWRDAPLWNDMKLQWRVEPTYGSRCGENVTWTYTTATRSLSFNGTGEMFSYATEDQVPWDLLRSGITSCTMDESVTSLCDFAFFGDTDLTSLPDIRHLHSIGKATFCGCPLNNNTFTIPASLKYIGDSAFAGWDNLEYIQFTEARDLEYIGNYAFYKCNNSGIWQYFPNSLKYIGDFAFAVNKNTNRIIPTTLPDSLRHIGKKAFEGRNIMWTTEIVMKGDLDYIGDSAFTDATACSRIFLSNDSTPAQLGTNAFPPTVNFVTVPYGSLTAYQNAPCWQDLNCHVGNFTMSVETSGSATTVMIYSEAWQNAHFKTIEAETYEVKKFDNYYYYIGGLSPKTTYNLTIYIVTKEGDREPFHYSITTDPVSLEGPFEIIKKDSLFRLSGQANMPDVKEGFGFEIQACHATTEEPYGDTIKANAVVKETTSNSLTFTANAVLSLLENDAFVYRVRPLWYDAKQDTMYYGQWTKMQSSGSGDPYYPEIPYIAPIVKIDTIEVSATSVILQCSLLIEGTSPITEYVVDVLIAPTYSSEGRQTFTFAGNNVQELEIVGLNPQTEYYLTLYVNTKEQTDIHLNYYSVTTRPAPAPNAYTITFVNWDNSVLQVLEDVPEGTMPEYTEDTPTHPNNDRYSYTFIRWSPTLAPAMSDTTYVAIYDSVEKTQEEKYTITFVNWDNSVLQVLENVPAGTIPAYTGDTPTRPEDDRYSYTFEGWTPTLASASANATYVAIYTATEKKQDGINEIRNKTTPKKVIDKGTLYIIRNGKRYGVNGNVHSIPQ